MTTKRLTRRQRNQALAARDAQNRCAICKRDLRTAAEIIEDFLIAGKFCSDACLEDARERANR